MARDAARIAPMLELLGEVWYKFPDLRLGQLIDIMRIDFYTEDINEAVQKMCVHGGFEFKEHALWGTRGKDGNLPLHYRKMIDLETEHLKEIVKLDYASAYIKNIAKEIISERSGQQSQKE